VSPTKTIERLETEAGSYHDRVSLLQATLYRRGPASNADRGTACWSWTWVVSVFDRRGSGDGTQAGEHDRRW
jgi:hypothetical protein